MSVFERCDFSPEWNQLCPEWYTDPDAPAPVGRWEFFSYKHTAACGETVIVKAKYFEHDSIVNGAAAEIEISPEFAASRVITATTQSTGIQIPVTMDKPGFVRIRCSANGTDGFYGIGFDIEEIKAAPEVDDFDEYWQG